MKDFYYKDQNGIEHEVYLRDSDYLYHGTLRSNQESIEKYGLSPRFSDFSLKAVWLEADENTAFAWGGGQDALVYKVKVQDLDIRKIELDPYNYEWYEDIIEENGYLEDGDATYIYKGTISFDKLEEVKW